MTRTKYGWQWTDGWGRKSNLEDMDNDQIIKLTNMARAIKGMPIPTSLIDLLQELESRHGTLAIWQLARINRIKSALNGFPDQEQTEQIEAPEKNRRHLAIAKWMLT